MLVDIHVNTAKKFCWLQRCALSGATPPPSMLSGCGAKRGFVIVLLFQESAYILAHSTQLRTSLRKQATVMNEGETKLLVDNATTQLTSGNWVRAFQMFHLASLNGSGIYATESMFHLAELQERTCGATSFVNDGTCPLVRNVTLALRLYKEAASLGHPGAQLTISVALSSGAFILGSSRELGVLGSYTNVRGNATYEDVALIHEYFAALSEEPLAMMALGWRHLHGYSVPANCDAALEYYQAAADASIMAILRGGVPRPNDRAQLSEQIHVTPQHGHIAYISSRISKKILSFAFSVFVKFKGIIRLVFEYDLPTVGSRGVIKSLIADDEVRTQRDKARSLQTDTSYPPEQTPSSQSTSRDESFWGVGGSPDRGSDVLRYYRYAAEQGDAHAQLAIGHFHYFGARGVKQDLNRAANYFERAARKGDPSAASWFGYMLAHGLGVHKNEVSALVWLRIGETAGDSIALNALGLLHLRGVYGRMGHGTHNDPSLRRSDEHIDVQAAANFPVSRDDSSDRSGSLSSSSPALIRDVERATSYFRLASEKGSADALYNLGMLQLGWDGRYNDEYSILINGALRTSNHDRPHQNSFQSGMVSSLNARKALQFFTLAAQSGHLRAYHLVGKMYTHGNGVARSCEVAVSAVKKESARGPSIVALAPAHAL